MAVNTKEPVSPQHGPPPGYQSANDDIVGFWKPESGPINGVLLSASQFINSKRRLTTLYRFKLLASCEVTAKLDDGGYTEAEAERGDIVGVFGTGAMKRPLANLRGAAVWMTPTGKKIETPAGEMWDYDIQFKGEGKPLIIATSETSKTTDDIDDFGF